MYLSFIIIRLIAIVIANAYVIFRLKKNYKRTQVINLCHSEQSIYPSKKGGNGGDQSTIMEFNTCEMNNFE